MTLVYASTGSAAFNAWLDDIFGRIAVDTRDALGGAFHALVIGGGYGRGEGAAVPGEGGERPYNDFDFVLVVERKARGMMEALAPVQARYHAEAGVHVDYSRPLTVEDIRCWPHWLMWYDLLWGHRVVLGPEDVLTANAPARVWEAPPLTEATRLLLNRGAGLLWAWRVLRGAASSEEADFVPRNGHKCALALGDALLLAHGRYATAYAGRKEAYAGLASEAAEVGALGLAEAYGQALDYRLHPVACPGGVFDEARLGELARWWGAVLLLVEARRMGRHWDSVADYAAWRGIREREEHGGARLLRNVVRNAQAGRLSWVYPRERLYRHLPGLLGLTDMPAADWASSNWAAAGASFLRQWERYN